MILKIFLSLPLPFELSNTLTPNEGMLWAVSFASQNMY